jgi:isorenieratene synthase
MSEDRMKLFGRDLPTAEPVSTVPDWRQADPEWIENALRLTQQRTGGGWTVVDASRNLGERPKNYKVAGVEWVVWRAAGRVHAAPDACPHMGAPLSGACTEDGNLVCPWHGLRLGPGGHGDWQPVDAYDDGHLVWIRAIAAESPTDLPVLPTRPDRALDAAIRHEAECEPADIIANRLDPWHGAHFHPYSFQNLRVIDQGEDDVTVRVVYRVVGRFGVEVDARFHSPDLRSIAMTILRGEGEGSIVETHATPISPGRSTVVELTLATSDHPRFWPVVRTIGGVLRPLVKRAAQRLWVDDAAYAERRYLLRKGRLPRPT